MSVKDFLKKNHFIKKNPEQEFNKQKLNDKEKITRHILRISIQQIKKDSIRKDQVKTGFTRRHKWR